MAARAPPSGRSTGHAERPAAGLPACPSWCSAAGEQILCWRTPTDATVSSRSTVTLPVSSPLTHAEASGADDTFAVWLATGDEAAFTALFLRHHGRLWKFAYGFVRSAEVAEEIVQDVFLSQWRSRAALQAGAATPAWLYAAVRNGARNHLRHRRVDMRLLSEAGAQAAREGTFGSAGPAPDDIVSGNELERDLMTALAELSERSRTAMTLRWKHGMSAAEIAAVLGGTPGSVRVVLTRARHDLARLLGYTVR